VIELMRQPLLQGGAEPRLWQRRAFAEQVQRDSKHRPGKADLLVGGQRCEARQQRKQRTRMS
jgi:hypothetical protein